MIRLMIYLTGGGEEIGLPGEVRTPDPHLRRMLLYPAELRAGGDSDYFSRVSFELILEDSVDTARLERL